MHRSLLVLVLSCTMACREKSPPEDTGCDGMLTWYDDADGDGYCDADATVVACTMRPGYSSNADDCVVS